MKKCPCCKETKPISEWGKNKSQRDGLGTHCKTCSASKSRNNRKNPKVKERHKILASEWKKTEKGKLAAKRERLSPAGKARVARFEAMESSKEKKKLRYISNKYKLSPEKYLGMVSSNPNCEICGDVLTESSTCIDHCHSTGKVRSLLCRYCNSLLGMARENQDTLLKAVQYLRKHSPELE